MLNNVLDNVYYIFIIVLFFICFVLVFLLVIQTLLSMIWQEDVDILELIRNGFKNFIKFCMKQSIQKKHFKYASSRFVLIRSICAELGYDLDILEQDPNEDVRREVVKKGYHVKSFLNDPDWCVRLEAEDYLKQNPETKIDSNQEKKLQCSTDIKNYMEQIKENSQIANQKMGFNIHRILEVLSQIIILIDEKPERARKCDHLVKYYLPTVLDLLTKYKKLEQMKLQEENILKTKAEIENALNMIRDSFETLMSNLAGDMPIDIKADVYVLRTLMAQEGLIESGKKY